MRQCLAQREEQGGHFPHCFSIGRAVGSPEALGASVLGSLGCMEGSVLGRDIGFSHGGWRLMVTGRPHLPGTCRAEERCGRRGAGMQGHARAVQRTGETLLCNFLEIAI